MSSPFMLDFCCRMGKVQLLSDEIISLLARVLTLDIVQSIDDSHVGDLLFTLVQEKDERWFVHILTISVIFYIR